MARNIIELGFFLMLIYTNVHGFMTRETAGLWSRLVHILQAAANLYSALIRVKQRAACKCRVQVCVLDASDSSRDPRGIKVSPEISYLFFWLVLDSCEFPS